MVSRAKQESFQLSGEVSLVCRASRCHECPGAHPLFLRVVGPPEWEGTRGPLDHWAVPSHSHPDLILEHFPMSASGEVTALGMELLQSGD